MKPQAIVDIECYYNYFLISFLRVSDNEVVFYEQIDTKPLNTNHVQGILNKYETVSFNGISYDLPMIQLALRGASCTELKLASDELIECNSVYQFRTKRELPDFRINHIDLIELCYGKSSLKMYGGRLHCKKLQDLPYEPSKILTKEEMEEVKLYCKNDLLLTKQLLEYLKPQIDLRRDMSDRYKLDLRSSSDAQIAEAVIKSELYKTTGVRVTRPESKSGSFKYDKPDFIQFESNLLDKALAVLDKFHFHVTSSGRIEMPKELAEMKITIGKSTYQMGMGGLHSTEKSVSHYSDENYMICDWDVTSYYPNIILNCELFPEQLGRDFLTVYRSIVEERIAAKGVDKVKADSLKITVNGSFGKLGSPYSALYSPKLMIQVTVTGQLALLMLIDNLEARGLKVISGNTDGIVIKCQRNREELMKKIIGDWEQTTGFTMERTDYSSLHSRDVNSYIAIKNNGGVKTKGFFSNSSISKNPQNDICNTAVVEYLKSKTDFEQTLKSCKDITQFITLRTVTGGAVKGKDYLGKAIRWYYAKGAKSNISYKKNGNSVPRSYGAKPIMDLPDTFPNDIDYDWYIAECKSIMNDIGIIMSGQMKLF